VHGFTNGSRPTKGVPRLSRHSSRSLIDQLSIHHDPATMQSLTMPLRPMRALSHLEMAIPRTPQYPWAKSSCLVVFT